MDFEALQKAWQSQDTGPKVTVNADLLLKMVRRNQQQFRTTILLRDFREVGVAFFLTFYFVQRGLHAHRWTDHLVGFACFGVGAFMVVDRLLQRRKQRAADNSLKACLESSLVQLNHQIWLLKNVLWWYLLPIAASIAVSVCVSAWPARHAIADLAGWGVYALFCVLLFWGINLLNQMAVRKSLEPRRQELETLLAGLEENSP